MLFPSLLLSAVLGTAPEVRPLAPGAAVPEFQVRDHRGAPRKLSDWSDRRLLVVAFLGVDCPLVKLYTRRLNEIARDYAPRGVAVLGINSNQHDQLRAISRFVREHELAFPL